jgi:hypothetical protein
MHQAYRHENDVPIVPQEPTTLAPASGELTAAALTLVVGGEDGPGNPTDNTTRSRM